MMPRRQFLDTVAALTTGLAISSGAKSYGQIMGSNRLVSFAVFGLNSREYAHLSALKANKANARTSHVCDVDTVILAKFAAATHQQMGEASATEQDFRKILAMKDVDAITIATPDHWHAPMAILGLQAGKHVYVEKPCSHNPAEGVIPRGERIHHCHVKNAVKDSSGKIVWSPVEVGYFRADAVSLDTH